jgi:hypothetical protein
MRFYLTPAPRCKAQIYDRHPRLEQSVLVIDLEKLERSSALQALNLGLPREAVGRLSTNPLLRRGGPALGERLPIQRCGRRG